MTNHMIMNCWSFPVFKYIHVLVIMGLWDKGRIFYLIYDNIRWGFSFPSWLSQKYDVVYVMKLNAFYVVIFMKIGNFEWGLSCIEHEKGTVFLCSSHEGV